MCKSKTLRFTYSDLLVYQKNRYPYLLIDVAEEVSPGLYSHGYKYCTGNEWYFQCHFPGDPNMPGMLQIEAMIQMASLSILSLPNNKGKILYLIKANDLSFKKKILPGDKFEINTKVLNYKRGIAHFEGLGKVSGQIACKALFSLALSEEFITPANSR